MNDLEEKSTTLVGASLTPGGATRMIIGLQERLETLEVVAVELRVTCRALWRRLDAAESEIKQLKGEAQDAEPRLRVVGKATGDGE